MKAFIDANVLLDVLFTRHPHYADSRRVWALAEVGAIEGCISAASLPIAFHMVRRTSGLAAAHAGIRFVRGIFEIVPLNRQIVDQALESSLDDFEDAIQLASALRAGADALITRDLDGFSQSELPVQSPSQFLASHFSAE